MKGALSPNCWCFKKPLKTQRIPCRDPQIVMSSLAPFLRRSRVRLQQVGDGKARAQRGAVAAIKEEQFRLGIVMERACDAPTDIVSNPGGAEPLAFEAEVGDLIKRIDHPEVRIEFQAVDNLNPVGEPDVLRAQIAVSVHNAAVADPLDEAASALVQKAVLDTFDSSHQPCWQIEAPIEQEATIAGDVVMPFVQLCDRQANRRPRPGRRSKGLAQTGPAARRRDKRPARVAG